MRKSDDHRIEIALGGGAAAGAIGGAPVGQIGSAAFYMSGNPVTRAATKKFLLDSLEGKKVKSPTIAGRKRLLKTLKITPPLMIGGKEKKKVLIDALERQIRMMEGTPMAKNIGRGALGLMTAGSIYKGMQKEKRAYTIPVRGASGPRKGGIATVKTSIPMPAGEPVGPSPISKKHVRKWRSKKMKNTPGNLSHIGLSIKTK